MCCSTKGLRLMLIIATTFVVFVAHHPTLVKGLEEKEEIVDDFDNSTANHWKVNYKEDNTSTMWYMSTHGDPPPFDLDSVRPPMEENGGGFIEVVPYSDSPAQIYSDVLDLLPGANVELTYWNIVPFPVFGRNTVLILYTEFVDIVQGAVESPPKSVQVFTAPLPTGPSPGWITVNIDLRINQPSKIQLRLDGNRANLAGTGLAISKIAIKNGEEMSTTSTTTTITISTLPDNTSSMEETQTETSSTSQTTDKATSFPNPSKFDVEKSTTEMPMTTTTSMQTETTSPSTTTTSPSTATTSPPMAQSSLSTITTLPSMTMTISSTSISTFLPSSTSTVTLNTSSIHSTTSANSESSNSSTVSPELTSSSSTDSTIISPNSSSSMASTSSESTTPQRSNTSTSMSTSSNLPSNSTLTTKSSIDNNLLNSTTSMSTTTFFSTNPPSGMTSQSRGIAIGVGVSIIFLVLSCLLFGFLYRRHRRRVYLIEKSQLEAGTIRPLEQLDHIPSDPQKADTDCCSISSTAASDAPLVLTPTTKSPIRDFLARFASVQSNLHNKDTKLT